MKRCIQFVTAVLALLLAYPLAAGALDLETASVEYVSVPDEILLDGVVEAVKQATVAAQKSFSMLMTS